jgi:hypothetical protein
VRPASVVLDGQRLSRLRTPQDGEMLFVKSGSTWRQEKSAWRNKSLRKSPGLTGPIDDAFVEPFVFVRPTGRPLNAAVGTWAQGEMERASVLWRDVFRGQAPLKDDTALTPADIQGKNLVLWGDPSSNAVLKKILGRLPLRWDASKIAFRNRTYSSANHVPILIFPNPLNPRRYVVLNSGIDFRAEAFGSNALQTPKLPDWAIVNLDEAPGPRWPGALASVGFFDEQWK